MTKQLKPRRSQTAPGQPAKNKDGLPYGTGTVHYRAANYWLVYRDADGQRVQESAHTQDVAVARRLLAKKSIATLRARIKMLQAVASEPVQTTPETAPVGDGVPVDGDRAKREGGDTGAMAKSDRGSVAAGKTGRAGKV